MARWRGLLLVAAYGCGLMPLAVLATGEASAPEEPGEILFVEGQKAETAGNLDEACRIYLEVANKYPASPSAPSALFQCGFIRDQQLHDVDGALEIYRLVVSRYHDSRAAARVERRLPSLLPFEGKWAATYKEFQKLLDTRKDIGEEAFEQEMLRLTEANPGYPRSPEYLFFLAKNAFRQNRFDDSRRLYRMVFDRYPGTLSAAFALKGLGDLEFTRNRYSQSAAYYDAATALGEKLGVPPPSPAQRVKAHLYVARYQALLGSFLLLALSAITLVWLAPAPAPWKELARSAGSTALWLLPLFAILFGVTAWLTFGTGDVESMVNISGREPRLVIASYLMTAIGVFIGNWIWPGAAAKPCGKAVFWPSFILFLVAGAYCLFYWLDLVFYLEAVLLDTDPKTGMPILPFLN
ncbi:MAG: tetratricopeptide repeat protein [Deltaproteobacteria bacterium]|nr:tetratricopeptide repeat protein [Deltaproteobacteria bacterium]